MTTDPIDVEIAAKVRTLRKERHMSQWQLGAAAGVTFQQIQKYENGANRVSTSRLYRLAKALAKPVADFFPRDGGAMASKTIHVVVAFRQTENGVEAEPPRRFNSAPAAEAAAKILSHSRSGVVAWSRYADPAAGEYGEPEELLRIGTIPEWFDAGEGSSSLTAGSRAAIVKLPA